MAVQTIGPSLSVGGNTVQMTTGGKVQVTNSQGKVQTLSQDEFKKQVIKNADKIQNGQDFEFKSNNGKKALKISTAIVGTAAVVAGVIYRKDIAKYIRNFTWKGFKQDIQNIGKKIKNYGKKIARGVKNLFKGNKKTQTIFGGTTASRIPADVKTAKETSALKNSIIAKMANDDVKAFDEMVARTKGVVHANKQKMYDRLFANV